MTPPALAEQPLLGCLVAVTADRRREDLAALLRRRGARVLEAPTLKLVPLEDDAELRAATRACIESPPDYVVATTGRGWRGWISAAEGWGDARELQSALAAAIDGVIGGRHHNVPLPPIPTEAEWAGEVARLCGWT